MMLCVLGMVSISAFSCSSGTTINPVRYFRILPAPQGIPPSFVDISSVTEPFPTDIFVLSPHEQMWLAIFTNDNFKQPISFSRFTFYDLDTKQEVDINFPIDPGHSSLHRQPPIIVMPRTYQETMKSEYILKIESWVPSHSRLSSQNNA